jgi:hypothetical protein
MDAITAFLQGKAKEKIYVELLDGYYNANSEYSKDGDDDNVVGLLLQALYGLKQSPRF